MTATFHDTKTILKTSNNYKEHRNMFFFHFLFSNDIFMCYNVNMKRYLIENNQFNIDDIMISGVEHNHLKNVMRTQVGDRVVVVTGDGFDYECEVVSIEKNYTKLVLIEKRKNLNEPKHKLTVFQALTKSDNMNLIVQKLTELGVTTLVPFENAYVTAKDKAGKAEKLQTVSNQSIKQCRRACPICVEKTISFNQVLTRLNDYDIVIFANEQEDACSLSALDFPYENIAIIVGSEGGFSEQEIAQLNGANNVKSITLGRRILRSETAAIALTSVVMFLQGEWTYE